MQTLGLSDSTPKSENRLKSLFWPSINTATDVDTLGSQGYWVCAAVAVFTAIGLILQGHPIMAAVMFLFFYLGGAGVRERSRYAAAMVFAMYALDMLTSPPSVIKILFAVLLLSNIRATWIAANWKPESAEAALPPRFSETWRDKFADQLPMWLWPKLRIAFYIFSAGLLILVTIGALMVFDQRIGH